MSGLSSSVAISTCCYTKYVVIDVQSDCKRHQISCIFDRQRELVFCRLIDYTTPRFVQKSTILAIQKMWFFQSVYT